MAWEYGESMGGKEHRSATKRGYMGKVIITSDYMEPWNIMHYRDVEDGCIATHIRSCVRWLWVAKWIANRWLRRQR